MVFGKLIRDRLIAAHQFYTTIALTLIQRHTHDNFYLK